MRVRGSSPLCSICPRRGSLATLLVALILLLAPARRSIAQPLDLVVTVVTLSPDVPAQVAIAYAAKLSDAEIRQDIEVLARELGIAPPRPKVDRRQPFPLVEFEVMGLVDWRTGSVNLNALVGCLRRFGAFRVICLHPLQFPVSANQVMARPPVRVETRVSPGLLDYRVWIDQSRGVPAKLPELNRPAGIDWGLILGIVSVVLGGGVAIFFGVVLLLNRRRESAEAEHEEQEQTSSSNQETGDYVDSD